jgi:hypothetical protein
MVILLWVVGIARPECEFRSFAARLGSIILAEIASGDGSWFTALSRYLKKLSSDGK